MQVIDETAEKDILVGTQDKASSEDDGSLDGFWGEPERQRDAVGEAEEVHDDEAAEELEPKRISPDPGRPSQSEIDEHEVDHLPYRCWCEDCVRGRGTGEQHRNTGETGAIPIIAFDYLFVTEDKVLRREEHAACDLSKQASEQVTKILVVKDLKSKAVFAHVVTQKGVDAEGYSVQRLMEDLKWLGYTKIILKADNERAIVRLLHEALRKIKVEAMDQVAQESPPSYDSRANGSIENAVKLVQGHLRTLKLSTERRLGRRIPARHALMSWLVEHVAWILTIRLRGEDGRTAYHRVRGRGFAKRMLVFGEQCLYKLPMKGPRHDARGKLAERWRRGIFLGFSRYSAEYILWDEKEIVKARAHQRLRVELRWPDGVHEAINEDAHSTYAPMDPERFEEIPETGEGPQPALPRGAQTIQIKRADWEKYGSTPGCPKCAHALAYGWGLTAGSHPNECVKRYKDLYRDSDEGLARVKRSE